MLNLYLLAGSALSLIAALLHLGCIAFGAPWYRFFGAGESMARQAEAGSPRPAVFAISIATVLVAWSFYALCGSGAIALRPPALRLVLCVVTGVYLLRGLAGCALAAFAATPSPIGRSTEFWWWSSAICGIFGLIHLLGLRQAWSQI